MRPARSSDDCTYRWSFSVRWLLYRALDWQWTWRRARGADGRGSSTGGAVVGAGCSQISPYDQRNKGNWPTASSKIVSLFAATRRVSQRTTTGRDFVLDGRVKHGIKWRDSWTFLRSGRRPPAIRPPPFSYKFLFFQKDPSPPPVLLLFNDYFSCRKFLSQQSTMSAIQPLSKTKMKRCDTSPRRNFPSLTTSTFHMTPVDNLWSHAWPFLGWYPASLSSGMSFSNWIWYTMPILTSTVIVDSQVIRGSIPILHGKLVHFWKCR